MYLNVSRYGARHSYTSFTAPTLLCLILNFILPYLTSMENNSLEIANHSPASRLQLLPGELLTEIMSYAMASDEPVFFWLFRNLTRSYRFYDLQQQRGYNKSYNTRSRVLPESQQQHLLAWLSVTGICHRLRECGIPAFFREKSFVVPPSMLRNILDGKVQSSYLDLAMDCIRKVVVPVRSFCSGSDFMILPKYHRFSRLSAMTIRAPDEQELIPDEWMKEKLWPLMETPTPKELHDVLRQLGLRLDITKLKLEIEDHEKSLVPSLIETIEQWVYPALRTLIQQRAKLGVAPP